MEPRGSTSISPTPLPSAEGSTPAHLPARAALAWDGGRAEHLVNRAGFGAGAAEIARLVGLGPEAAVAELLISDAWIEEPFYGRKRVDENLRGPLKKLPEAERQQRMNEMRKDDRAQLGDFIDWWLARLVAGEEPLRERMTLFWHGHFTSSIEVVKSSYELIQQNQLLRRHALGSFRELLRGIARDPAMLSYLDNDVNRSGRPNENFARELLELFTLGEGNYSESDVREVARAFTGWTAKDGRFRLQPGWHDDGPKRVLGVEGALDGADVIEILLSQAACARHIARKLLRYFEGVEPEPARLERYAALFREGDYRIDSFLRELLLDPDFYRDAVLGTRITSPIDYLVGAVRRLGLEPPGRLVYAGAALLGERLFAPPGVQGWEGGPSWITTSSLLLRGNLAGVLLGCVSLAELLGQDVPGGLASGAEEASATAAANMSANKARIPVELRELRGTSWRPRLNLTQRFARPGASSDAELAGLLLSELLAVPVEAEFVARVAGLLAEKREAQGLAEGQLSSNVELCEPILRELAFEILSLPEAQLH